MNAILHDPGDAALNPQQATPHSSPRPGLSRWPVVLAAAFAAVLIALLAIALVAVNALSSARTRVAAAAAACIPARDALTSADALS